MSQTFKNTQNLSTQPLLKCVFDPAHMITKERMQYHLNKCRKSILARPDSPYYNKVKDMQECPFYSLHWVPKDKFEEHCRNCDKSGSLLKFTAPRAASSEQSWAGCVDTSDLSKICAGGGDENWDDDEEENHYDPMKKIQENPHLLFNPQGKTKSEKAEYRIARSKAAAEHKFSGGQQQPQQGPPPQQHFKWDRKREKSLKDSDEESTVGTLTEDLVKVAISPKAEEEVNNDFHKKVTPIGRGVGRGVGRGQPGRGIAMKPPPGFVEK